VEPIGASHHVLELAELLLSSPQFLVVRTWWEFLDPGRKCRSPRPADVLDLKGRIKKKGKRDEKRC
jgi:hypothetical protein